MFWKFCQAAEVCGTLEIDSALDTVGALGRDLEAYEKSIEEGKLLPLPGDTVSIYREHSFLHYYNTASSIEQGAKKIMFIACRLGKLRQSFTSPKVILTSSKSLLTSRINFTVGLQFEFLKKHHLPVGQVKN